MPRLMKAWAPFRSLPAPCHDCPMLMRHAPVLVVFLMSAGSVLAAPRTAPVPSGEVRYEQCLSQANLNPAAALATAAKWSAERGGAPAEHCTAVALVSLKRYGEGAAKLEEL